MYKYVKAAITAEAYISTVYFEAHLFYYYEQYLQLKPVNLGLRLALCFLCILLYVFFLSCDSLFVL